VLVQNFYQISSVAWTSRITTRWYCDSSLLVHTTGSTW